jgi:multicomponent Na+:H+ antiporter subunit G
MSWTSALDVLSGTALVLGSALALVAAIGMVRFPDLLSRMHSATKPQVLGLFLVLLGVALSLRDRSSMGLLALVALFQLATAPIASHMVARASFRAGQIRDDLLIVDELSEREAGGRTDDQPGQRRL